MLLENIEVELIYLSTSLCRIQHHVPSQPFQLHLQEPKQETTL